MIPRKYRPPMPIHWWRGNNTYQIREAPDGYRYIGSCNGIDIAIGTDHADVARILIESGKTASGKKRKGNY